VLNGSMSWASKECSVVLDEGANFCHVFNPAFTKFLPFVLCQVEYDLEVSRPDDIQLVSSERVEQSAMPLSMAWYPPITKEAFIVTVNDQV